MLRHGLALVLLLDQFSRQVWRDEAQAMRTMTTDLFTRLTADRYGKGSGLCFIAQRISSTDLVAEMIAR